MWDVVDGLHYLHSCNIIHGNLKGVSLPSQLFSESDINTNEFEGEHSDRRGWSRPSHRLRGIHHSGDANCYFSALQHDKRDDDVGGARDLARESCGDIFTFAMVAVEVCTRCSLQAFQAHYRTYCGTDVHRRPSVCYQLPRRDIRYPDWEAPRTTSHNGPRRTMGYYE